MSMEMLAMEPRLRSEAHDVISDSAGIADLEHLIAATG